MGVILFLAAKERLHLFNEFAQFNSHHSFVSFANIPVTCIKEMLSDLGMPRAEKSRKGFVQRPDFGYGD